MSAHPYTEDQLVEQPAIGLFAELGWQTVSAAEELFGRSRGDETHLSRAGSQSLLTSSPTICLGRETKGEVVLVSQLRAALERLNPALPPEAITAAVDELTRDRSAMSMEAANREVYLLLKEGIKVSVPETDSTPHPGPLPGRGGEGGGALGTARPTKGGQTTVRVQVIDWEQPANNDFLLVSQFSVTGALYTCRPDLVGFVNGLPLVIIELKKPGVPARAAFDENLTHYKAEIPQLFWFNALLIASNGTDSRVGSLTANWERFFEWKRIEREDEPRRVSLEVMLRGTCDRARLLDLVENFTLFSEHKAGLVKIIAQNHQYLGVNNTIASMLKARTLGHGRGGVYWQTQGSGKAYSMVFFSQKVLRKIPGNWTFVVGTDRVELDDQIAKTFKATGAVSEAEGDQCHAESGAHLRELLRGNHRYVFTLIHKFRLETPSPGPSGHPLPSDGRGAGGEGIMPVLCDRADVIVLADEAHRSQYDTLALNMRAALPKAVFIAFTGTPLIAGEERTKEVFGDYVSIYDFQQSVEDGATVPLFYENRTPELQLVNPDLNEDIYNLIETAELDPEQEAKLERELSRQYHILTRDDRLETVAQDIVRHFLGRGFIGKAMVVSIDKATALKMHDKVRKHWAAERERVEKELGRYDLAVDKKDELSKRLDVLKTTDMALIVSPGQNEIQQMQARGLDIVPHRQRMNESDPGLDEKFKDTTDPLRIVFVCAMWLTGFDAPSCSTVYLDKPMRNHTLMQTIARANRVFPGKHSGRGGRDQTLGTLYAFAVGAGTYASPYAQTDSLPVGPLFEAYPQFFFRTWAVDAPFCRRRMNIVPLPVEFLVFQDRAVVVEPHAESRARVFAERCLSTQAFVLSAVIGAEFREIFGHESFVSFGAVHPKGTKPRDVAKAWHGVRWVRKSEGLFFKRHRVLVADTGDVEKISESFKRLSSCLRVGGVTFSQKNDVGERRGAAVKETGMQQGQFIARPIDGDSPIRLAIGLVEGPLPLDGRLVEFDRGAVERDLVGPLSRD